MRRATLLAFASLAAVLIQLTMLNRLPLPGGAAPDLVLILVVAVGLTGGPMEGMLTGFFAGLTVDIAPPASHLVGQSALVFCLAGYACGRLSGGLDAATWLPLPAVALCTAAGEALYAAAGMLFGDPGITWPTVRHVLPVSVGYDLVVCPFVLLAAVAFRAWTTSGWAAGDYAAGRGALAGRAAAAGRGALAGPAPAGTGAAVRDTRTGRSPRLRAAAARPGDGWIGGAGQRVGRAAAQVLAARPVHLRLRGVQTGSASRGAVSKTLPARPVHMRFGHGRGGSARTAGNARTFPARPVHMRFGGAARRRDGALGGRVTGPTARGGKAGRLPRGSALRRSGPGGSALGGGGASLRKRLRSSSRKGAEPHFRRHPGRGASGRVRRRGGLAGGGLLRRSRRHARFGRRSTVWRIGSKRKGGWS